MNFVRENKGRPRARACAATSHSSPSGKYTIQNSAETPFAKERVHARVCLDGAASSRTGAAHETGTTAAILPAERERNTDGRTDGRIGPTDERERDRGSEGRHASDGKVRDRDRGRTTQQRVFSLA